MWSVSMICDKQECNALYSWLCKNDYHSHQCRCEDPTTEFYINCEAKVFSMVGFIGHNDPKSSFSSTDDHGLCLGFTQIINTILTIQGMRSYNCAKAIDTLHAINNSCDDFPVPSKGTIGAKEFEELDGMDIRELMGKKCEQYGNLYISEGALSDLESWLNMQSPRKTEDDMRLDVVLDQYAPNIILDQYAPKVVTYGQSVANIMSLEVSEDFHKEEVEDIPF